jgi:hypothetical protein
MSKARKTWREKLEKEEGLPKIVDVPEKWQKRYGTGKMVMAKPLDVDALMRNIEKGKLATITQIRERLAKDYHADVTCPLTAGIFIRIAAEVAEEDLKEGKKQITPYWRVIRSNGSLNEKFPGGIKAQAERLREEGHIVSSGRGKKLRVKDFEGALQKM